MRAASGGLVAVRRLVGLTARRSDLSPVMWMAAVPWSERAGGVYILYGVRTGIDKVNMMAMLETAEIIIGLSEDWSVYADGKQLVAQGPQNAEIIVSSSVLEGRGTEAKRREALESLSSRVKELMLSNAANPELATTSELSGGVSACGIAVSYLSSASIDGEVVFDQFMLAADKEVLFLTYEGPVAAVECRAFVRAAVESARHR
jgi:hypothetical protein